MPNTAPEISPPGSPAIIAASSTGICRIVRDTVGFRVMNPSRVMPSTTIRALIAPVTAIFLFTDKALLSM